MSLFNKDVYEQLKKSSFYFQGKRCLDIGTRDAENCFNLIELGADSVVGIDIDDSRFPEINSEFIKLYKTNLLYFNDDYGFDVITCFLWNIRLEIYQDLIDKIKLLLKPDGTIFIGIHDYLYKFGYDGVPNTGSVIELVQKNFSYYNILDKDSPFQWIIKITT